MGIMNRIAVFKQHNQTFNGARESPEIAAMRAIHAECMDRNLGKDEPQERIVNEGNGGDCPF